MSARANASVFSLQGAFAPAASFSAAATPRARACARRRLLLLLMFMLARDMMIDHEMALSTPKYVAPAADVTTPYSKRPSNDRPSLSFR